MKNNENDYRKSVDLLTNIIKIQNVIYFLLKESY